MKNKKNMTSRLGVAAVALTLVSTCLMGGTLAKYTTTVSGTGTADVAAWKIAFKEGSNAMTGTTHTFTLADTGTNSTNVTTNKVAPGSTGSFVLSIDGSGTEVSYKYTIKINTTKLNGLPIKFYSDSQMSTEIPTTGYTDDVAKDAANKQTDTTIYWKWVTATDSDDTTIGEAEATTDGSKTGTFTVEMTAEQTVQ